MKFYIIQQYLNFIIKLPVNKKNLIEFCLKKLLDFVKIIHNSFDNDDNADDNGEEKKKKEEEEEEEEDDDDDDDNLNEKNEITKIYNEIQSLLLSLFSINSGKIISILIKILYYYDKIYKNENNLNIFNLFKEIKFKKNFNFDPFIVSLPTTLLKGSTHHNLSFLTKKIKTLNNNKMNGNQYNNQDDYMGEYELDYHGDEDGGDLDFGSGDNDEDYDDYDNDDVGDDENENEDEENNKCINKFQKLNKSNEKKKDLIWLIYLCKIYKKINKKEPEIMKAIIGILFKKIKEMNFTPIKDKKKGKIAWVNKVKQFKYYIILLCSVVNTQITNEQTITEFFNYLLTLLNSRGQVLKTVIILAFCNIKQNCWAILNDLLVNKIKEINFEELKIKRNSLIEPKLNLFTLIYKQYLYYLTMNGKEIKKDILLIVNNFIQIILEYLSIDTTKKNFIDIDLRYNFFYLVRLFLENANNNINLNNNNLKTAFHTLLPYCSILNVGKLKKEQDLRQLRKFLKMKLNNKDHEKKVEERILLQLESIEYLALQTIISIFKYPIFDLNLLERYIDRENSKSQKNSNIQNEKKGNTERETINKNELILYQIIKTLSNKEEKVYKIILFNLLNYLFNLYPDKLSKIFYKQSFNGNINNSIIYTWIIVNSLLKKQIDLNDVHFINFILFNFQNSHYVIQNLITELYHLNLVRFLSHQKDEKKEGENQTGEKEKGESESENTKSNTEKDKGKKPKEVESGNENLAPILHSKSCLMTEQLALDNKNINEFFAKLKPELSYQIVKKNLKIYWNLLIKLKLNNNKLNNLIITEYIIQQKELILNNLKPWIKNLKFIRDNIKSKEEFKFIIQFFYKILFKDKIINLNLYQSLWQSLYSNHSNMYIIIQILISSGIGKFNLKHLIASKQIALYLTNEMSQSFFDLLLRSNQLQNFNNFHQQNQLLLKNSMKLISTNEFVIVLLSNLVNFTINKSNSKLTLILHLIFLSFNSKIQFIGQESKTLLSNLIINLIFRSEKELPKYNHTLATSLLNYLKNNNNFDNNNNINFDNNNNNNYNTNNNDNNNNNTTINSNNNDNNNINSTSNINSKRRKRRRSSNITGTINNNNNSFEINKLINLVIKTFQIIKPTLKKDWTNEAFKWIIWKKEKIESKKQINVISKSHQIFRMVLNNYHDLNYFIKEIINNLCNLFNIKNSNNYLIDKLFLENLLTLKLLIKKNNDLIKVPIIYWFCLLCFKLKNNQINKIIFKIFLQLIKKKLLNNNNWNILITNKPRFLMNKKSSTILYLYKLLLNFFDFSTNFNSLIILFNNLLIIENDQLTNYGNQIFFFNLFIFLPLLMYKIDHFHKNDNFNKNDIEEDEESLLKKELEMELFSDEEIIDKDDDEELEKKNIDKDEESEEENFKVDIFSDSYLLKIYNNLLKNSKLYNFGNITKILINYKTYKNSNDFCNDIKNDLIKIIKIKNQSFILTILIKIINNNLIKSNKYYIKLFNLFLNNFNFNKFTVKNNNLFLQKIINILIKNKKLIDNNSFYSNLNNVMKQVNFSNNNNNNNKKKKKNNKDQNQNQNQDIPYQKLSSTISQQFIFRIQENLNTLKLNNLIKVNTDVPKNTFSTLLSSEKMNLKLRKNFPQLIDFETLQKDRAKHLEERNEIFKKLKTYKIKNIAKSTKQNSSIGNLNKITKTFLNIPEASIFDDSDDDSEENSDDLSDIANLNNSDLDIVNSDSSTDIEINFSNEEKDDYGDENEGSEEYNEEEDDTELEDDLEHESIFYDFGSNDDFNDFKDQFGGDTIKIDLTGINNNDDDSDYLDSNNDDDNDDKDDDDDDDDNDDDHDDDDDDDNDSNDEQNEEMNKVNYSSLRGKNPLKSLSNIFSLMNSNDNNEEMIQDLDRKISSRINKLEDNLYKSDIKYNNFTPVKKKKKTNFFRKNNNNSNSDDYDDDDYDDDDNYHDEQNEKRRNTNEKLINSHNLYQNRLHNILDQQQKDIQNRFQEITQNSFLDHIQEVLNQGLNEDEIDENITNQMNLLNELNNNLFSEKKQKEFNVLAENLNLQIKSWQDSGKIVKFIDINEMFFIFNNSVNLFNSIFKAYKFLVNQIILFIKENKLKIITELKIDQFLPYKNHKNQTLFKQIGDRHFNNLSKKINNLSKDTKKFKDFKNNRFKLIQKIDSNLENYFDKLIILERIIKIEKEKSINNRNHNLIIHSLIEVSLYFLHFYYSFLEFSKLSKYSLSMKFNNIEDWLVETNQEIITISNSLN
ncbi:RIBOSOMAL RNA-PROCESSING 1 [Anaeramoeba flamelloides]|uniref:RIBOSOMAL RNA-PROCESSING 1 n=1 Tax=Anaeramoeba flamelloides TaxID=1746091 RepID=A0ABQ8XAD3_9EUKA|nr:RIBOSOMAL RNA-PROCESSING 1 [Anaeramoeba flamelloides]